ncbi:hypothetical protein AUJ14_00400 [Candidatus Micrarchaeota archaeon CG1_02_55_22]|nr:MAG: hypothetical protein AUJ14_00400 [Candidatus Micrarchaeota archaeon CG1_02_55_22]
MVDVEVKVNVKGQIVIPKVFRDAYGIAPGSTATLAEGDGELVLRPKKSMAEFERFLNAMPKVRLGKIDSDADYDAEMKSRWTT